VIFETFKLHVRMHEKEPGRVEMAVIFELMFKLLVRMHENDPCRGGRGCDL
jgi:hypothetical protein